MEGKEKRARVVELAQQTAELFARYGVDRVEVLAAGR